MHSNYIYFYAFSPIFISFILFACRGWLVVDETKIQLRICHFEHFFQDFNHNLTFNSKPAYRRICHRFLHSWKKFVQPHQTTRKKKQKKVCDRSGSAYFCFYTYEKNGQRNIAYERRVVGNFSLRLLFPYTCIFDFSYNFSSVVLKRRIFHLCAKKIMPTQ